MSMRIGSTASPGHSSPSSRRRDIRLLCDEDLVQRLADGEPRALGAIFDRHSAAACSLAYRICGQPEVVEDVVAAAFREVYDGAAGYRAARGSVRSWVLGIVRARAIGARGQMRPDDRGRASDRPGPASRSAPRRAADEQRPGDDAQRVRSALATLTPEQRQVIELAYFDGLTHHQIAQACNLTDVAVKETMRLGLLGLRTGLGPAS